MTGDTFDTSQPFTTATARAGGMPMSRLRSRDIRRLHRGVFIGADVTVDLKVRCRAALLCLPDDAHISHHTAAELLGLWVDPHPEVHVCRAAPHRTNRQGARAHQCQSHGEGRAEDAVWIRDGLPLSAPTTVFLELADTLDLVALVTLGDSIVRMGWATPESLRELCSTFRGDGAVQAREAAALVRAGVDSRPESRLRLILVFGGLPEPTVQLEVRDESGILLFRFDLGYREYLLAAEYDGAGHRASDEQWGKDLQRREVVATDGWLSTVFLKEDVYRQPSRTVRRVHDALRSRGWRGQLTPRPDFARYFRDY